MSTVVISQPMFFPWVGMLEQLKACDVFVHYDDAQFSKGSFTNRVQVKTATGIKWMTVPLENAHLGSLIRDLRVDGRREWRRAHVDLLKQAYRSAPHREQMLEVVARVYALRTPWLAELAMASMQALADVFGVRPAREVMSSELPSPGRGSQRVLEMVKALGGHRYVSGAGGRAYLQHLAFEAAGVAVEYMRYACAPYPQLHGEFTPFVSALDALAQCGPQAQQLLVSTTVGWKEKV